MMISKEKRILTIAMVISMFFWGLSWPSAKVITDYASPINLVVYRYIIVAFTLLPILWFFKIKVILPLNAIPYILLSAFLLALYSIVMFKGLKLGFAGAGGILVTTLNPIIAYLLSLLIQKKIPSYRESIALFLGLLAGTALLEIWNNSDNLWKLANVLFLLAAFIWVVMSRITAISSRYGSPFSFSFWMYLSTFLILIPLMDFSEIPVTMKKSDFLFWSNLFFGGAIVTSLATSIYFYATTKLGSDKASSFIFLVPFSAGISSFLLLGESLEIHTIIGGIIAILAVYLLQKGKKS